MNITVLGCGRWGTFHAWYANYLKCSTVLWGRAGSLRLEKLQQEHANEYLQLDEKVRLTHDLDAALEHADTVIISISAQALRTFAKNLAEKNIAGKRFVLCMKGLEASTGKRLSEIFYEETNIYPAVWLGPGHVQEFVQGFPNCMVLSAKDKSLAMELVCDFKSPLIRFYHCEDLVGAEIGAAAKNVMGLAAGMLDGLNRSSLKGALMARGTRELARLIEASGGEAMTVYGLSHLGDYEATLFSKYSNNRLYGENFVRQIPSSKLAEGVSTVRALLKLASIFGVSLPICETVNACIHEGREPKECLSNLFLRPLKGELD